jgi:hypothetical protein
MEGFGNRLQGGRTMRFASLSIALALALALAGPAAARDRGDRLSGAGEVVQKDMQAMTVTIHGTAYHVVERTRIHDSDGKQLTLAQLPVPQAGEKGLWKILGAHYEAVERGNDLLLISLDLVDAPD